MPAPGGLPSLLLHLAFDDKDKKEGKLDEDTAIILGGFTAFFLTWGLVAGMVYAIQAASHGVVYVLAYLFGH